MGLTETKNQGEKEGDLGSVQHVASGQRQEKEIDLELRQEVSQQAQGGVIEKDHGPVL